MKLTSIILIIASSLAYFSLAPAVCCHSSLVMYFAVDGGAYGQAGGLTTPKGCKITICADGRAKMGNFCGRGSCDKLGCNCGGGCITGKWQQSFLDLNRQHKIVVTSAY